METREDLELWVEDYLDGMLPAAQARAFEARLVEPAVAAMVAESLALRCLLTELPADAVPEGLTDRIEAALGVGEAPARRFSRLRAMWSGASWVVRGPAHATSGDELAPVALAATPLTPLTMLLPRREPRPLWRRVLSLGLGGRGGR